MTVRISTIDEVQPFRCALVAFVQFVAARAVAQCHRIGTEGFAFMDEPQDPLGLVHMNAGGFAGFSNSPAADAHEQQGAG
jgi:hypothetical protein